MRASRGRLAWRKEKFRQSVVKLINAIVLLQQTAVCYFYAAIALLLLRHRHLEAMNIVCNANTKKSNNITYIIEKINKLIRTRRLKVVLAFPFAGKIDIRWRYSQQEDHIWQELNLRATCQLVTGNCSDNQVTSVYCCFAAQWKSTTQAT